MTQGPPEPLPPLATGGLRRWGPTLAVLVAVVVVVATIWIGELILGAVDARRDQAIRSGIDRAIEGAVRDFEADVDGGKAEPATPAGDQPILQPPGAADD
ncbi:MAG: hypothetical protein QGH45_06775 [Myxococcota bacterium]|jgi:hypothetical protein|nr:hypothetical protein [Myxococcota bacterium]